ncbi:hypothetical protein [Rhizobium alvei]|uniref:Uncharacterized protein n=1 Tax=Rhizobium alvei TaxID=1132659 RepID=A0ABT8YSQ3_9HYPH|nr:hypothetical protein [Rhizobium alvei]MDO6966739.1 hypothetical protein [Rhizobium alvei]
MKSNKPAKWHQTIDFVGLLTWISLLGLLGFWAWFSINALKLTKAGECYNNITNPIWHLFACLKPNEAGDLLAGVFAPAATVLLAFALFVQMRELKAQRTEMKDTREVFQEQSVLMNAQIEEAKRSANLLEKQNAILAAQEKDRLRRADAAEFDMWLRTIEIIIRSRLGNDDILIYRGGECTEKRSITRIPDHLKETSTETLIARFVSHAKLQREALVALEADIYINPASEYVHKLLEILKILFNISQNSKEISAKFEILDLISILRLLSEYAEAQ